MVEFCNQTYSSTAVYVTIVHCYVAWGGGGKAVLSPRPTGDKKAYVIYDFRKVHKTINERNFKNGMKFGLFLESRGSFMVRESYGSEYKALPC